MRGQTRDPVGASRACARTRADPQRAGAGSGREPSRAALTAPRHWASAQPGHASSFHGRSPRTPRRDNLRRVPRRATSWASSDNTGTDTVFPSAVGSRAANGRPISSTAAACAEAHRRCLCELRRRASASRTAAAWRSAYGASVAPAGAGVQ